MAAPSYTDSGYSAPASPAYNPSITDGERILELRPSLSSLPVDLPDKYVFRSQRIELCLGARIWPTSTPCYGFTSAVEGAVSVTSLDHVKRIKVILECVTKSSFTERGVLSGHVESVLFQRPLTLYTSGSTESSSTTSYPFLITFPETADHSETPLPPSFVQFLPGVSAEVRYRIRVDMARSGLRRRESLIVPILYLPRSYTPPVIRSSIFDPGSSSLPEESLKELSLEPKSTNRPTSKNNISPVTDVQAKIALPCPLVAASGNRIPFILTIRSQSPALAALYTDVTLQLVKITKIKAHERSSFKETVMSFGEVYNAEQCGDGVHVLRGEIGNGVPGRELSWSAGGLVEVKHIVRLSIKPPPCRTALASNLPIFEGKIAIEITTHKHSVDMNRTAPALSLVGIDMP